MSERCVRPVVLSHNSSNKKISFRRLAAAVTMVAFFNNILNFIPTPNSAANRYMRIMTETRLEGSFLRAPKTNAKKSIDARAVWKAFPRQVSSPFPSAAVILHDLPTTSIHLNETTPAIILGRSLENNFIPVEQSIPLFDDTQCPSWMEPWQKRSYPNCNLLHSMDFGRTGSAGLHVLGVGGARMAWEVRQQGYRDEVVALRTYKFGPTNPKLKLFESVRIDAMLSERLTASQHTIKIYGHCGLSTMSEIGSTDHWFERHNTSTPIEKLDHATQLARALADFHSIDGADRPTAVWGNMKPENILVVNGTLKINDFDDSVLLRRNVTNNQTCKFRVPEFSPKEKRFKPIEAAVQGRPLDAAMDVYSFGAMIHVFLTGQKPWAGLNETTIVKNMNDGTVPLIRKAETKEPCGYATIELLERLMKKCMAKNPKSRPKAINIYKELESMKFKALAGKC